MSINLYQELKIESTFKLSVDDYETLIFLYQPIIESNALMLYLTLYHEATNKEARVINVLHKEICDLMGITILNFEKYRKLLEGVGLIQTFTNNDSFVIILRHPLSPSRFLNETSLGGILKNQIPGEMFNLIYNKFKSDEIDTSNLKEITKTLDECFKIQVNDELVSVRKAKAAVIKSNFDMDSFLSKIKNTLSDDQITKSFINKVKNLADNYSLTPQEMKQVVIKSCVNRAFDISKMTENAEEINRKKKNNLITIELQSEVNNKVSDEEKESIKDLIKKHFKISNSSNVKLIIDLMEKTGLNLNQIDELLEMVKENTNGEFPTASYFDKAATNYIQSGMRSKKTKKTKSSKQQLIDEYYTNMGVESWKN